jgi:hypothetical protein
VKVCVFSVRTGLSKAAFAPSGCDLAGAPSFWSFRLVQKDYSVRLKPHDRPARQGPFLGRLLYLGPIMLASPQSLMEWPPPSGVVGSPANQEEEGMDISVLGIDLGKNLCSVVGLDASGAVCHASQGEAGDADCSGGEACSVRCRDGGLLRASS